TLRIACFSDSLPRDIAAGAEATTFCDAALLTSFALREACRLRVYAMTLTPPGMPEPGGRAVQEGPLRRPARRHWVKPARDCASCGLKGADAVKRQAGFLEGLGSAQIGQINDGRGFDYVRAKALQKLCRGKHGAAGGDKVINQQDTLAGFDG